MPHVDLVRGFTITRKDGSAATFTAGVNQVSDADAEHFMVKALTVKPGERLQFAGAAGTVEADPTPSVGQGEVAPVGHEETGKLAIPTGGGSAPKRQSKADPRPAAVIPGVEAVVAARFIEAPKG